MTVPKDSLRILVAPVPAISNTTSRQDGSNRMVDQGSLEPSTAALIADLRTSPTKAMGRVQTLGDCPVSFPLTDVPNRHYESLVAFGEACARPVLGSQQTSQAAAPSTTARRIMLLGGKGPDRSLRGAQAKPSWSNQAQATLHGRKGDDHLRVGDHDPTLA